ncbi:tetratricopeptide repeat protein [Neochlamydia sp. AcF84]|uniref:tetratricopeptide repeat protein n=1 Tax=Neochlamydia sp. AcF84 TaxID=2315858 RepID=UPI00140E6187|nr:tetratricopeptide repeat protein [Neochlamydia sp. AcF84]
MNLDNLSTSSFTFPAFQEIENRTQDRKLGPYTEISLEIFEKLACQGLCQARLVCKEWKRLVEQTSLWKKLYSASFEVGSQQEEQPGDKLQPIDLSSCKWNKAQIAKFLWQDSTTIISDSIKAKVKAAAAYLKEEGVELKGVASDGDCFFSAFLGSYACLSRKIPLLDDCEDKISYLRQVLADIIKHTDSERAEEIKRKATWVSGLGEGDLLASALSIPIRLVTINEEKLVCGIHDRLIFSKQGLSEENRSQEWKTIPQKERLKEYIFIVDLGGHFAYAQKHLKQDLPLFLDSKSSSTAFLSNSLPINALKSPLETSGSKKLLSDEQIKEAEEAYTQALKRAVEEKDLIQESFCIERLGDIYLRKETSETLLQAAGLYNYALHKAPQERQKVLKDRLSEVQNLLVKQCKGKPFETVVVEKQFENNRKVLKKFREEIEEKIQRLPETPSSQEVRKLYAEIACQIKIFFRQLAIQVFDNLGSAPCDYAMIGFGSLAREEMTPYSDLEFGILIEEDTLGNREYFKCFTILLHLQVINLGETILPALNIPCLKAINFFDGMTPRGFAFDGAGVEGKGCKTPLGNGKTFELIQTPEQMAQYVGKNEKGHWWHEKEPHLPMELLNFTHLLGNLKLTTAYDEKIQEALDMSYQYSLDLRQYLAKQHLIPDDMETFNPGMGDLGRDGMLFQVKKDFYRFPHLALDRLALLKKVEVSDTFSRINKLKKLGILTQIAAEKLKDWMSLALFMRLKIYSHYQAQKEMMNPLLKHFGFEDPDLIKEQFALDRKALKEIKKIYRIFIPFYQAIKEFLVGNEEILRSSDLDDNSINTKGEIALRLFQYLKAEKWYRRAIEVNPQNSHALCILGAIYKEQGYLDKAAEYTNKSLVINLKLFGENHLWVAGDYNNLGQIYKAQGKLDKAAEYGEKALAIDLRLFKEDHSVIARDYNNLGLIYKEQGNLDKAAEYTSKSLAINIELYEARKYPMIAIDYGNLGLIYQAQGNLSKAAEYSKKALAIHLELFGEHHPRVAIDYSNLGLLYKDQGYLKEAAEYVKKALSINLKLHGEKHFNVARDYNNLGQIYAYQSDLEQALEYTNKALAIDLKLFGENHSNIAAYYSNLGSIYQSKGNLENSAAYREKALAINVKLFGENYPKVATNYSNLGIMYQDQGKLEQAEEYLRQALNITYKLFGENHLSLASVYNSLGAIFKSQGNLGKAVKYINKALAIDLKLYGENHYAVARDYNTLGQACHEQGNLDKAAEYSNKALAIDLKLFGENHLTVARDYNNLGQIYQAQGNLNKAADYNHKALLIDLNLFGENHPNVAILYNNLGQIYQAQGNLDKAAEYSNKALAIDLKLFGENHPTEARDYNNLGAIYQAQGNLDRTVEHSNKALAIDLKLFGENHPNVAIRYDNLGQIYQAQGNLDKAAENSNKALAIDLKLFGENHPKVARDYNNLGAIYQAQGNLDKASEYSNKALAIDLKLFGENHPNVARDYNNLGAIYQAQGNLDRTVENSNKALVIARGNLGKAEEYSSKALAIDLKLFGENHPNVARDYNNLGQIYQAQGNLNKAADYNHKALAIDLKLFGENHPNVAICYNNLGQIYQAQGNLDKAAEYSNKALAIDLKLFGENHPNVARDYNNLGAIYQAQGNLDRTVEHSNKALVIARGNLGKAEEYSSKALAIDLKFFGENHPNVAKDYNNLGQIYQEQGDLGKAADYISKAFAISLKLFGDNHPTAVIYYNNLGRVYQKQGKLEKAFEHISKALQLAYRLYGKDHPNVITICNNILTLFLEAYLTGPRKK